MARKRIFDDRRGKEVFLGGKRRTLSFPELEERRPGRNGRTRSAADRQGAPVRFERAAPAREKAIRVNRIYVALGLLGVGVAAFLVWFFFFVYPSPIKSVTPSPSSRVNKPEIEIKVAIAGGARSKEITLKLDGQDISTQAAEDKQGVSCKAQVADGAHKVDFTLNSGGLMGKRSTSWAFTVDTTAPVLQVTDKKITNVKGSRDVSLSFTGQTDKDAVVKIGDKALPVDSKGGFKYETRATRAKSLMVTATDPAGNVANTYIVTQRPTAAKGVHVSVYIASSESGLGKMIDLVDSTELNALQIDLKDESGQIGFEFDNELAKQAGSMVDYIKLDPMIDRLRYRDVYTICRIVVFKDPKLAKSRPDLAVQDKNGGVWSKGEWLDPYSKEVWDYNLDVAVAAAKAGFNEVQFDYMRFPSDGNTSACLYPQQDARNPGQVIGDFVGYARQKLAPYNVFISADLFGLTASQQGEMGIGQRVQDISKLVDYISPMVYPSHYNTGEYGIKSPENNPADIVTKSLEDFKNAMKGTSAKLRPWLQDFSLRVAYSPDMVRAQIDATEQVGVDQWLLWDPDCTYSQEALKPADAK